MPKCPQAETLVAHAHGRFMRISGFPRQDKAMTVVLLVLPDFLLVALGWALRSRLGFSREFFAGLEKLVYYVLFPTLLFQSILRTPISLHAAAGLLSASALVVLSGIVLTGLAKFVLKPDSVTHASVAQCGYRFNTYIGLALSASLAGPTGQAVMAVILGFAIPMVNVAAVYSLARQNGNGLAGELIRNPLLISTALALACNFSGLQLPAPVDSVLARLGSAAVALGILCVGAGLLWEGTRRAAPLMVWMLSVKLVAMPWVALWAGRLMGLDPLQRDMLLLFAALPTASAAYVLAMRMGGDGKRVAQLISLSTVLSAITIALWMM